MESVQFFRHAASCEFSIRSILSAQCSLSHTSSNNSLDHPCPPAAVTRPLVHVLVYQENWRLLLSFNTRRHLVCVFSFAIVWLQYNSIGHVIIWLPLALLAIETLKEKRTRFWFAVLLFSQISALLAGHPQLAGYLLLFVLAYTFILARPLVKNVMRSILLALGISAIQLIPGIELIWYAARSSHEFSFIFQKYLSNPNSY